MVATGGDCQWRLPVSSGNSGIRGNQEDDFNEVNQTNNLQLYRKGLSKMTDLFCSMECLPGGGLVIVNFIKEKGLTKVT